MTLNRFHSYNRLDLRTAAFQELNTFIRTQETIVQSWMKFYLTVQFGLSIAYSYTVSAIVPCDIIYTFLSICIALFGYLTAILFTAIICREYKWQGYFMKKLREVDTKNLIIDGTVYKFTDMDEDVADDTLLAFIRLRFSQFYSLKKRGHDAKCVSVISWILSGFWVLALGLVMLKIFDP